MSEPEDLEPKDLEWVADALLTVRNEKNLPPRWDGKLAEAEINLRGVAAALDAREP